MENHLNNFTLRLISAGIDWISLSSTDAHTARRMREFYNSVLVCDRELGYDSKRCGLLGFLGEKTRHAFLGEREGRWFLQVSGQAAQPTMKLAMGRANCTRLDVQVTVQIAPGAVNRLLDAVEVLARGTTRALRDDRRVRSMRAARGNETVYIGSRHSDVFIRCYDKFAESGEERFRDCVRFEVVLKGKRSAAIWNHCVADGVGTAYLLKILYFYLEQNLIDTSWIPTDWSYIRPEPLGASKLEATIGWWSSQVVPSIVRIANERGWHLPFAVLFGSWLTERDFHAILRGMAVSYGD